MHPEIVEVLYYKLYNAVLLGEKSEYVDFLAMLREAYEEDSSAFKILEKDNRFEHLQHLGYIIDNNLVKKIDFSESIQEENKLLEAQNSVNEEKELKYLLYENINKLKELIEAKDGFYFGLFECKTRFGIIDITARDKETMFVIELKRNKVKHDIIGQIEKYIIFFKLKLILKLWKKVIAVVVANDYDKFILKRLKHSGVICLQYFYKNKNLNLLRI